MKTFEKLERSQWRSRYSNPHGKVVKRQCCSPENEQVFNYAKQYPQLPRHHRQSSWQKLPWQTPEDVNYWKPEWNPRKFPSIIFPVVNAMGICENYVSGECDYDIFKVCRDPVNRLAETIAPTYNVKMECEPGDMVYYCGQLYECIEAHPGSAWDKRHFKPISVEKKFIEVDKELDKKTEPAEVSVMISSALSSTLVDYTTHDDVQHIVEGNLVGYATEEYADNSAQAHAASAVAAVSSYVTSSYVRVDALSGHSIASNPT